MTDETSSSSSSKKIPFSDDDWDDDDWDDDDCDKHEDKIPPKRKRNPRSSNFEKMIDIITENDKKREANRVERQKRHEDRIAQNNSFLDILKSAFAQESHEKSA